MLYKISLFREIQFTAMDSDEHKMQSNRLNFVILMPEKQIAPIIGWGGKTIKQIRNETTDAKIHISSKSATSSERAVTISGDSVSVIRACELIYLELEKGTDNKIKPFICLQQPDRKRRGYNPGDQKDDRLQCQTIL